MMREENLLINWWVFFFLKAKVINSADSRASQEVSEGLWDLPAFIYPSDCPAVCYLHLKPRHSPAVPRRQTSSKLRADRLRGRRPGVPDRVG